MEEQYAVQTLREAITQISAMPASDAGSERFARWQSHACDALTALGGEEAPDVTQFRHIVYRVGAAERGSRCAEHLWQTGKDLAKQILCDAVRRAEQAASLARGDQSLPAANQDAVGLAANRAGQNCKALESERETR